MSIIVETNSIFVLILVGSKNLRIINKANKKIVFLLLGTIKYNHHLSKAIVLNSQINVYLCCNNWQKVVKIGIMIYRKEE